MPGVIRPWNITLHSCEAGKNRKASYLQSRNRKQIHVFGTRHKYTHDRPGITTINLVSLNSARDLNTRSNLLTGSRSGQRWRCKHARRRRPHATRVHSRKDYDTTRFVRSLPACRPRLILCTQETANSLNKQNSDNSSLYLTFVQRIAKYDGGEID